MKCEWKEIPFGELLEIPLRNGVSKPKSVRGNGYKMVNMGELFSNSRIYDIEMDRAPLTEKEKETSLVEVGDLLFARQSLVFSGAGKCSIIKEVCESTTYESHLIRARINRDLASPDYMYYYFSSPQGRGRIQSIVEQVSAAGIRGSDLSKLDVSVPSLEIQEKIADILCCFDDKIELNNKINANLQQQAQAIFKSWFVDFEPWGGEKPSTWIDAPLGTFVEIKRGGSPRPIKDFLADNGLRWLKISDVTSLNSPFVLDIKEHIKKEGLRKTVYLNVGELVLSNSATPGIPKILDVDSCIHDGWLYFPKSQFSKYWLYLFFLYIRKKLVALGNGSVFTNLKTDILKAYMVMKPTEDILAKFDEIVTPMFAAMLNCDRENARLASLRDNLLPKLMNGEIEIDGI